MIDHAHRHGQILLAEWHNEFRQIGLNRSQQDSVMAMMTIHACRHMEYLRLQTLMHETITRLITKQQTEAKQEFARSTEWHPGGK